MALTISFWILAVVMIIAALGVVLLRNVFRAALSLILCFLMVAGLYITLSADFLAAVQILVYVGAISVLIILAIMMTREVQRGSPPNRLQFPAFVVTLLFFEVLVLTVINTPWQISSTPPLAPTTAPHATQHFCEGGVIFPVVNAAVILKTAIKGAIVVAKDK